MKKKYEEELNQNQFSRNEEFFKQYQITQDGLINLLYYLDHIYLDFSVVNAKNETIYQTVVGLLKNINIIVEQIQYTIWLALIRLLFLGLRSFRRLKEEQNYNSILNQRLNHLKKTIWLTQFNLNLNIFNLTRQNFHQILKINFKNNLMTNFTNLSLKLLLKLIKNVYYKIQFQNKDIIEFYCQCNNIADFGQPQLNLIKQFQTLRMNKLLILTLIQKVKIYQYQEYLQVLQQQYLSLYISIIYIKISNKNKNLNLVKQPESTKYFRQKLIYTNQTNPLNFFEYFVIRTKTFNLAIEFQKFTLNLIYFYLSYFRMLFFRELDIFNQFIQWQIVSYYDFKNSFQYNRINLQIQKNCSYHQPVASYHFFAGAQFYFFFLIQMQSELLKFSLSLTEILQFHQLLIKPLKIYGRLIKYRFIAGSIKGMNLNPIHH
ncbi:unnamed protein product [Paramecium sonneborni]|uniref:Uncharacterized protein n=1 Tax=Paramecium sonneborni TaxID=65129 RepID=A0A8S1PEQ4_9CILI|nr:unnamed protein product [Paramecium sonneborni]